MDSDIDRLVLRPFSREDDSALSGWFATAGELRFFSDKRVAWPPTSAQWEGIRRDPAVLAWTATLSSGHAPIGHGELVEKSPTVVGLERIAIDPALRGNGWGRALVAALLARAKASGYASVRQRVHRENTSALRLYRGLGFVQTDPDTSASRVVLELRFERDAPR